MRTARRSSAQLVGAAVGGLCYQSQSQNGPAVAEGRFAEGLAAVDGRAAIGGDPGMTSLHWSSALLLEPAAKRGECFVCVVQKHDFDRHLFWFLQENYNSGPTINNLLASQGLCIHHMQALRERRAQWQVTFFAELLMDYNRRLAEKTLKRARSARRAGLTDILRPKRRLGDVFAPKAECPICAVLQQSESFVISAIVNAARSPELETVWPNVCLPHGFALAALLPDELARGVTNSVRTRLDAELRDPSAFFLGAFPRASRSAYFPSIEREIRAHERVPFKAAIVTDVDATPGAEIEWNGCPLCTALQSEHRQLLEAPVHEYCRPDIAALLEQPRGEAAGQLREWAAAAIEQHEAHPSRRTKPKTAHTTTCPTCRERSRRLLSILAVLEDAPARKLGRLRFCIPHLRLVLDRIGPEAAERVLQRQNDLFEHIRGELAEFFRKADYRFQDEPRGSEQTAWMRAADVLAGCWLSD
jgi:hypothetical protein